MQWDCRCRYIRNVYIGHISLYSSGLRMCLCIYPFLKMLRALSSSTGFINIQFAVLNTWSLSDLHSALAPTHIETRADTKTPDTIYTGMEHCVNAHIYWPNFTQKIRQVINESLLKGNQYTVSCPLSSCHSFSHTNTDPALKVHNPFYVLWVGGTPCYFSEKTKKYCLFLVWS